MPHRLRRRLAAAGFAPLLLASVAAAQTPVHVPSSAPLVTPPGPVDASIPMPRAVLGYVVGERFTPHHLVVRYFERIATASPRVRLDTLGRTFEGREVIMATVTSEANMRRLDQIRADAQRLAEGGVRGDERDAIAARMPAIVWLGFTVHGNEASGTEASLALLHRLAAFQDEDTQRILDSVVVLIDPLQNPDGHERHVQDNMRLRGALGVPVTPGTMVHTGNWPGGRTSHYYFDLNRDWFLLSHPESRARVGAFNTWWPHVAVDLHEMGSNSTYFFAPPMEPVNKNVGPNIAKWWDIFAAANAAAFDEQGWPYFRREGYDEFYPGYGVSWPILTGAVGMTYEQASSAGGAIRRTDGSILTLRDAALHHYTTALATLRTTAARRGERVRDYLEFRRTAAADATRGGMRAVVFAGERGRADSLAQMLLRNGIRVHRLRDAADVDGTPFGGAAAARARVPAGAYVVGLAQPQGRLARALLEPDAQLDSSFIREELEARRTGRGNRFYDVTAWSLPLTFNLRAWTVAAVPNGAEPVAAAAPAAGPPTVVTGGAPLAQARFGYAFAPGSEASLRLLGALLADSAVRIWYAPRAFRNGEANFPHGAFIARPANPAAPADPAGAGRAFHEAVRGGAIRAGATVAPLASAMVSDGTDLGSNSVVPVRPPRVALLGGPAVNGNSFGFTWFAFDQRLAYPTAAVDASTIGSGILREFDVLVVPSAGAGALDAALGDGGRQRLAAWVRDGGVLITLDAATGWLARESLGLSRLRPAPAAPDSTGAPLPAGVPGAAVRVAADTLSPLLAGIRETDLAVLMNSDRILAAPRDVRPGEVVLRHAPVGQLRIAGYLWPEVPARLAGTPYLWTERVGRGRVIAFAGDPNFRDMWRGLLPVFANAVFLGGVF